MKKTLAIVGVLLSLYVVAYLALLASDSVVVSKRGPPYQLGPAYRIERDAVETAFLPVHLVDRWLRPEHWQFSEENQPDVPDWYAPEMPAQ